MGQRISAKEALLLLKKENTENVFIAPGVTDWTRAFDIDMSIDGDEIAYEVDCGKLGSKEKTRVAVHVSLKFSLYLTGSGTAGVAPSYAPILQACGYREDVFTGGADDRVEYTPISDGYDSASAIFYIGANKHPMKGLRGNISFEKSAKNYDKATVEMKGTYIVASEEANHATPNCNSGVSPVPIGPDHTSVSLLGLTDLEIYSLNINSGRSPVFEETMTTRSTEIDIREMSGDIEIAAIPINVKDWDASYGNKGVLEFINGTVSGNIVEMLCPNVQLLQHSYGKQGNYQSSKIPLNIMPSAGDDDIKITVK